MTVNKYSNAYHGTIKVKPVDFKPRIQIDLNKENIKDGSKFKVGYYRGISKYF